MNLLNTERSKSKTMNWAIWLLFWGSITPLSCKQNNTQKTTISLRCPGSYRRIPSREKKIWKHLRKVENRFPQTKHLRHKRMLMCFGQIRSSVITTRGVMLIDQRLKSLQAAARVAHLGMHLLYPIRFTTQPDCIQQVKSALLKEAEAISLELKILKVFNIHTTPFSFGHQYWKTPSARRRQFVYAQLMHPSKGGSSVLTTDYTRRCRKQRSHPTRQK